jgi:multidrug efflux system membrane fusion protein
MSAGTVNILTVLNTENALFSAQDELVQVQYAACRLWWICSPRSAAAGIKGDALDECSGNRNQGLIGAASSSSSSWLIWRGRLHKVRPTPRARTRRRRPIAVDTAAVTQADVPIYLQGLGTVQAFYTVTVTARVDGELQKIASPKVKRCTRAICWRKSIRARIKRHTSRRSPPRRRTRRSWRTPSAISSATPCCSRRIWRASRPSTRSARWSISLTRSSSRSGAHRQCAHPARLHAHRLAHRRPHRHTPGRSGQHRACGRHHGIVVVTQVQPISVIFTLPEEDLGASAAALAAGPVKSPRWRATAARNSIEGTLELIDNEIDQATGTLKLKATIRANAHNTLWPGQYVNARVLVRTDATR